MYIWPEKQGKNGKGRDRGRFADIVPIYAKLFDYRPDNFGACKMLLSVYIFRWLLLYSILYNFGAKEHTFSSSF